MSNDNSPSPGSSWEGLSPDSKRRMIIQAVVYVVLVVCAFRSLSKQNPTDLRGPKSLWKSVIPATTVRLGPGQAFVAPLGPLLYFAFGKRWRQSR